MLPKKFGKQMYGSFDGASIAGSHVPIFTDGPGGTNTFSHLSMPVLKDPIVSLGLGLEQRVLAKKHVSDFVVWGVAPAHGQIGMPAQSFKLALSGKIHFYRIEGLCMDTGTRQLGLGMLRRWKNGDAPANACDLLNAFATD